VNVTATAKTVDTYKAEKSTIVLETAPAEGNADKRTASVNILAGKQNADLQDAVVTDTASPFKLAGVNGSKLNFTYTTGVEKGKTYNFTVNVLPKDSLYLSEYTAKTTPADKQSVIKSNGIPVKVSIVVKDKAAATNRITIEKKALSQTFTVENYDPSDECYKIYVPYKETIPCDIKDIDSGDNIDVIRFSKETAADGQNYIVIALPKDKFADNVKAQATLNNKLLAYGATVTSVAKVNFDGSEKPDTFKFTLKLPQEAAKTNYSEALDKVQKNLDTIGNSVTVAYDENMSGLTDGVPVESQLTFTGTEEELYSGEHEFLASVYDAISGSLYSAIREYAPAESNLTVDFTQSKETDGTITITLQNGDFTKPTRTTAGRLTVNATLANGKEGTADTPANVTFTLNVPKLGEQPCDVETALEDFVGSDTTKNYTKYLTTVTSQTTAADIKEAARKAVLGTGTENADTYSTLRLGVELTGTQDNTITGTITVWGTRYGGDTVSRPFTFSYTN
jgi:hypothetical protein